MKSRKMIAGGLMLALAGLASMTWAQVGVDMLAVYVNKDNPIAGLTMQQVDAIFSSTRCGGHGEDITRWGRVGMSGAWANRTISVYGRNSASGTYGFFKENALFGGDFRNEVKEQPGSSSVVQGVASELNGIGYSGIGYMTAVVVAMPGSASAQGSMATLEDECGHTIDQLTNQRDQKLRQLWGIARLIDDVRVSGYGDGPIHEDQAEFAKTYAIAYAYDHTAAANRITTKAKLDCPEISKTGYLNHLRELSPIRFAVFEQMCVVTGGMIEGDTAPSPDIDLDAVRRKMIDLGERMRPAIEQVQETVKRICEKREG